VTDVKKAVFWDIGAYPDDGGSKLFWKASRYLPDYMALHPRRKPSLSLDMFVVFNIVFIWWLNFELSVVSVTKITVMLIYCALFALNFESCCFRNLRTRSPASGSGWSHLVINSVSFMFFGFLLSPPFSLTLQKLGSYVHCIAIKMW
jgi:hypothetical protein